MVKGRYKSGPDSTWEVTAIAAHAHTRTHAHTCTHTHTRTHTHARMHTHTHMRAHIHTHTHAGGEGALEAVFGIWLLQDHSPIWIMTLDSYGRISY